jgi:hypothetical protein
MKTGFAGAIEMLQEQLAASADLIEKTVGIRLTLAAGWLLCRMNFSESLQVRERRKNRESERMKRSGYL